MVVLILIILSLFWLSTSIFLSNAYAKVQFSIRRGSPAIHINYSVSATRRYQFRSRIAWPNFPKTFAEELISFSYHRITDKSIRRGKRSRDKLAISAWVAQLFPTVAGKFRKFCKVFRPKIGPQKGGANFGIIDPNLAWFGETRAYWEFQNADKLWWRGRGYLNDWRDDWGPWKMLRGERGRKFRQ